MNGTKNPTNIRWIRRYGRSKPRRIVHDRVVKLLKKQNSSFQTQPVSTPTQIRNRSTTLGKMTLFSPHSITRAIYVSTPFALHHPPNSLPPASSLVEQFRQFQQPTSVTPSVLGQSAVSVHSCINNCLSLEAKVRLFSPGALSTSDQISADFSDLHKWVTVRNFLVKKRIWWTHFRLY